MFVYLILFNLKVTYKSTNSLKIIVSLYWSIFQNLHCNVWSSMKLVYFRSEQVFEIFLVQQLSKVPLLQFSKDPEQFKLTPKLCMEASRTTSIKKWMKNRQQYLDILLPNIFFYFIKSWKASIVFVSFKYRL